MVALAESVWQYLQSVSRERFPRDPDQWLPEERLCRTGYLRIKKRYMSGDSERGITSDIVRRLAAEKAATMGLCTEEAGGTVSQLSPQRLVYGDVTVHIRTSG